MRFAVIESSSERCSVALSVYGAVSARDAVGGNDHGASVLPLLDALLRQAEVAADALDAVVYGAGPGSFTGLRIACSVAQGLAFARSLPVLGVSSFEAIAESVAERPPGTARVLVCIDARMNEVYCAGLERDAAGEWRETIPACCVAPADVPALPGEGWIGAGSGFSSYRAQLAPGTLGRLSSVREDVVPRAAIIAALAGPRLSRGEGVDPALAAPTYLRDKVARTTEERRVG